MPWDNFYLLSFSISVHSSSSGFPPWFSFLFVFIRGSLLLMFVHSVIKKQLPYWKQGLWVSSSYLIHPLLKQYDKSYIWKEIKDKAFKKKKHLNVRLMFIFTYISVEAPKFFLSSLSQSRYRGSDISVNAFISLLPCKDSLWYNVLFFSICIFTHCIF